MKIEQVRKLSPLEHVVYWIRERESIRIKRSLGVAPPWTDDEILSTYRFCNVRRADDAVSQWLIKRWYKPYKDHPNILVACALARFFNLPSTLDAIGFPDVWEPSAVRNKLRKLQRVQTIFNAAYMVRGNDGVDKVACVINHTIQQLAKSPPTVDSTSMENTWNNLIPVRGLGSFMAGQIVADLRWGLSGSWSDKRRWAPLGPGSRRGMNRLLSRPISQPMSQEEFNEHLTQFIEAAAPLLSNDTTKRLEAIDWQNILCETDKYVRTLNGEGRPKRRFMPCQ